MNPLLLIIGLALLAFGVFQLLKSLKLSKSGIKMEATIVDVLKKKSTSQDEDGYNTTTDMYYPVFSYTYEGETYTKESTVGTSNSRKHNVGGILNIVFMSDKPGDAKIKGFMDLWFMPGLLLLGGMVVLISSFVA